jgi:hypothetical protein
MGGCNGSWRDLVPLCPRHHQLHDEQPFEWRSTFPALDLAAAATLISESYEEGGMPASLPSTLEGAERLGFRIIPGHGLATLWKLGTEVIETDQRGEQRLVVPTSDLAAALEETTEFGRRTFPRATTASVAAHLQREALELAASPCDPNEIADVVILLAHLAHLAGVDLTLAVRAKHEINLARTWGQPDSQGVVEHVREA